jgi:16S rRNA (uracil1498-N3)-methyltransferase
MTRVTDFGESFYVHPDAVSENRVSVRGAEARHIAVVLRRKAGEIIHITDGTGATYRVELRVCTPSEVEGEILGSERAQFAGPEIWIAAGIVKAPRMDELVERCTELGASAVVPLLTKRSLSGKSVSDERLERWRRIAAGAMTQSARVFLPRVYEPVSPESLTGLCGPEAQLILADPAGKKLGSVGSSVLKARRLVGCVGPEGGFTPEEVGRLVASGAVPVTLGSARLRTETAAAVLADRLCFIVTGEQ